MKTEKHYNLLLGKAGGCGRKGNTSEIWRVWIISPWRIPGDLIAETFEISRFSGVSGFCQRFNSWLSAEMAPDKTSRFNVENIFL